MRNKSSRTKTLDRNNLGNIEINVDDQLKKIKCIEKQFIRRQFKDCRQDMNYINAIVKKWNKNNKNQELQVVEFFQESHCDIVC